MPTPLEIAREDNRNFLLYSDEDLVNELYSQYQDRYPDKRLFTEFLTTDTNAFDTSRLTGTTVQPSPETIEEEPKEEKPFGLTTLPEFGADLITSAIPAGTIQAVGSGLKYGAGLEKMPDYFSGDLQEVTAQYRAALSILNEKDQYSPEIVDRAEQIVDTYRNQYSAKESEFFKAGEELQQFAQKTFPQDQRWKDNKLADTIYKGFEGIGSTIPIIGASVVGAPFGVGTVAGLGTAIAMEGGESVDRVYAFDGDTDETDVVMATILGVAPGSADYLPVQILLNRFNKVVPGVKSRVANILKQSVTQGVWEGGTEEFQNVLQNLIEQTYNKERETFDYAGEQFGPGFVAGLVFGGIGGSVQRKEKLDDKVDEKTILEDDGSETIEGDTEKATQEATEVGTSDEVAPDSSPDGYPPVGSNNIVLTKSGEPIGKGRVVEYPVVLNDDGSTSKNIRVELDNGGIVEEPLDRDLKIDWLDKPETKPVEEKVAPVEEEIIPVEAMPETEIIDDLDTEIKTEGRKVGDEIELFDIAGRRYRTTITAIDEKSGSMRVLDQQGNDVLVNGNTGSATTVDINDTNYTIDTAGLDLQGVNPNNLTLEELQDAQQKLEQRKKDIESAGTVNQLVYPETIRDLNAVKVANKKLQAKETKPSLQVDAITGDNGWNRQMGKAISSDNETLKDELTQLPLDNLLSQENNLSALKVTSRYIEQGKLENETVQKNFDAINKRIAELEGRPIEQPTPVVKETPVVEETTPEAVAPVVEEKPLTTVEKIFAEPTTTPVEPVKKEEEKDVLTEDEMAGFLSTLEDTDAVTKETPVVKDEITQREEAVQKKEDDLTFGQGIFRLYDPRLPLRTAKEYNDSLNAYRREIADPSVIGRKYLQDVEKAYAKRVNQLTNTEFLDNLNTDGQADPLNYTQFERLLKELGNATLDIKDQATGKLIRKKTAEIKVKPVRDAIKYIKDRNYDKKPPETPPLPEFAEQKEEVSERDTKTITDITDVERGESVLGSREQPDTDVSGASERVTTGVRGVPTSVSKPTPDTSGERGRPRREDESVDPTEGQDVQSRNEIEGRLVGDNITRNVSGQLGDTVTGIESSSVPDTTETQQELRDNAQRKHDNVVAERSLASDIGKIEGLNNNDKQIIKDVFTYDYDIFEEVYLDYDVTTLQGFKKTKIPSYLQNDIEETLIDTMEDQQELLQQIYDTTKNKYPELSPNINRYHQEKLEEDFDDFASSLNDLKSRITPPEDAGASATPDSGVGKVEYGAEIFSVPTIKPTKESYDKVKPQLLKRLDQHSKAGLPFQSAMKSLINDIDRSFIDSSLTPEQKNEARSNSEQWKTSMGAFLRFATDVRSEYKNVQGERNTLFQTKYNPKVKGNSLDTHMPIELLASSGKGLRNLDVRVGDIKQYVADNLDMSLDEVNDKFGSEQIEALGLAIDQLKANKGFVLGDQTGIGKGRVVAALMRYAKKNAQHVVFVTHKSGLYTDMIRDMKDIGEDVSNMKILPTDNNHTVDLSSLNEEGFKTETREKHEALLNKLSSDQGMLENNYDYIFTTYYQLNRDSKADEQGFKTPINKARHNFIESVAPNAIFILDESHNAGGSSNRKVKADKINTRATFIRHALNNSRGAVFSSATWAKNPVVMDLYMNTDIQESIPDSDQFVDVMQTRGIPLQQIVTNMLAQTGQYRRVERSFDGVEYSVYNDGKGVVHDKELAKQISDLFLDIHLIDMQLSDIAKKIASSDPDFASAQAKTGLQGRVVPSDFKSQMYNISTMLMTSFKVNDAVNYANNEVKNNQRKVVITVSRTGENLLRQIMADKSLKAGDRITLTYNDLLLKYLDRALEYSMSVKVPKADVPIYTARKKLTNEEVNEFGEGNLVEQIEELKGRIRDTDFGNLTLNPVDNIINNLRNSNIKVGEITGRQYAIDSKGIITPRGDSSIKKRRRIDSFQNGDLDVLVINQSASTGYSMHSDQRAKDKKQRHMIVLEAEPEINTYLQMLGRIFRTGQVSLPKYTIMTTDHPAEQRLSSMLAKKMASLNATVTGGQDSVYTTSDSLDFFNTLGDNVTKEFLESHAEIRDVLDIDLTGKIDGIANKVSSSLLIFDPALATEYYDFVAKRYVELKEEETAFGTNTLDMANLTKADAISIGEVDMIQDGSTTGTIFQQPVYMEQVSINKKTKPLTPLQLQKELRTTLDLTTENVELNTKNVQEKVDEYNEKQLDQAVEIYDTAIEKIRQDTTKKPAQIQSQVKKLQDVKNQITRNIKSFPVGTQVRISLNTGKDNAIVEHGIILDRKHEGTSTATNTGSFKIKIALAQGDAQKITLGLSRFIDNQGNLSSENRIENASTTPEGKSIDQLFVSGQENVRETRYIVTGNLLTGSAIVKGGQVAKLQRNDGTIIQTIVMPKNYKHEKEEASIPVLLDYQAATSYLYNSKFGELKTYSGDVRIQKTGGDSATVFTTRKDLIERGLDKSSESMVDLDFKKSSDGRTWSATTKLDVLENYVLPYYAENGINFQTIKEREIAKESKEKVILQNEGDPTPRSVGAMATPPDMNENNTKDDVIKKSRNTLTSLFKIIKNKKRIDPFIDKDRSSTDRIHIPEETSSKTTKEGIVPSFTILLKYILPTYVTANQLKDKSIAKLIQKAIEYESKIRVRSKTFIDRYKNIRTKYKGSQFSKVVDILFVGDASQKVFTDKELQEGFTLTKQEIADLRSQGFSTNEINKIKSVKFSNNEIAMYKEIRLLFDKIGKYIDQHRRSMLPKVRSAQALIRTRLNSLISPDSLSDFKRLMVQRSNKMRQIRNGIGNPQTQLAELLEIDERIYSIPLINTSPTTFNSFINAYQKYYIEENKLQSTSVRRKVGYVPHKFFGNFKLKVLKEVDENNNEIYENLITPQLSQQAIEGLKAQGRTDAEIESIASAVESSKNTLFFSSKEDAIKAAQEHIKNNPTDVIRVEPTDLQIYSNDATVLNDQEYRSIMNSLTESLSEKYTAEELQGNIKDVMKRKGRRRIPEFSLKRKGVAGYDKNLDKVFRTFAGSVSKYVYMDELKYDYVNLMERKGWGEVSEVSGDAEPIASYLRSWWNDLNNNPQSWERSVDNALNNMEKSVPKKVFYAAGIGAIATPFVIGGPVAPLVIIGSTSIMMARSMGKTQRKSRAITGDMLSLSAHLKLGAFFNLSSALVNLSQIGLNTYSKMGAVLTSAGFRRATPALYRLARNDYREIIENRKNYSASKVNAAMDALLLAQKAEIKSSYFYSDRAPDIFTEQSKLGQLSMLWFQSAESLNRATSFFAGYIKAEKQGKNREQAIKSGLFAVQQQQFSYDNAAKPGVLRNTFLRVPLQFKNWFIQELVFISGLRGAEIPRFLASTFVLAGALGHPAYMLLSQLISLITGGEYEPDEDLKEWAINESAKGNLNGMVGQFITHGAPSIISEGGTGVGINLTNRVGFGDRFLPSEISDFYGPFVNTLITSSKLKQEGATAVDHLVNLSPAFKPLKSIEAMAGGMPLSTIATDTELFTNKMAETLQGDQKPVYTNPYKNQSIKYELTLSDVFRMTFGFEPTKVAQFNDLTQNIRSNKEKKLKSLEDVRTDINIAVRKYGDDYENLNVALTFIIEEAIKNGIEISRTGIKRMIKDSFFSQIDKDLKLAPKTQRLEIIDQIKALEKYYGLDFSQLVD